MRAPRLHCRGITLLELIVFIVVVSVGLVGILSVFDLTVRSSGNPLQQKQMLAIAEAMMEEIMLKDYADTAGNCTQSTSPSCNPNSILDRPNYSAIDHYDKYSQPASYALGDSPGNPSNPALAAYTVTVAIDKTQVPTGIAAAGPAALITVTVAGAGSTLSLTGYRMDYGG